MKMLKSLNLKQIICLIFSIIIIIIILNNVRNNYEQKAFLRFCVESCLQDIYDFMRQENSIKFYGYYDICFGIEKKSLMSSFYIEYIINKDNIKVYLESLNWHEIITTNNKDIATILTTVRENYILYIYKQENNYTFNLLQNVNLEEIKEKIMDVLRISIASLDINSLKKTIAMSNVFLIDLMDNIEWDLYIRTFEFQKEDFSILIEILKDKINNINISSDMKMLTSKEANSWYTLLRNTLLITTFVTNFIRIKNAYIIYSNINDPKSVSILIKNILKITKISLLREELIKEFINYFFEIIKRK